MALENKKIVPLVIYDNGLRHEIGEASVNLDTGVVECTIPADKLRDPNGIASVILKATPASFSPFPDPVGPKYPPELEKQPRLIDKIENPEIILTGNINPYLGPIEVIDHITERPTD